MNDSLATKDRLAIMLDKLKDRQCRLTPQRMAILKELALSTAHPTVETVYEKVKANFPTTSRATVYKTINLPIVVTVMMVINRIRIPILFARNVKKS